MVFGNDFRRSHRFRASVLTRDLNGLDDFMGEIAMNDLEAYYEAAEQEEEEEEERQKQQNEHPQEQRHHNRIASVTQTVGAAIEIMKMNDSVYFSNAEESSSDRPLPLTRPQQDRQPTGTEPVGALEAIFRRSPGRRARRGGSISDSHTSPSRDNAHETTTQTSSSRTNNLEQERRRESEVGDHHPQHHHDESSNGPEHHENRRSSVKKEEERSNNRRSHHSPGSSPSRDRYELLNDAARHPNVEHPPIVERKSVTHLGTVSHRSPRLELYSAGVSPRRVTRKTIAQVVLHANAASPLPRYAPPSPQVVHRRRVESTPSPKRGRIHRRSTSGSIPVAGEEEEEGTTASRRRDSCSSSRRRSSSRRPSPSPMDHADGSAALTKEEGRERRRRSPGAARSSSRSSSATPSETHEEDDTPSRGAVSVSESMPTDHSDRLVNPADTESLPPPPPPLLSPRRRRSSSRSHRTHRHGTSPRREETSPSHRRSSSTSDRKSGPRSKTGTPGANQEDEDSTSFGADDSELLMIHPDMVAVPPPPPLLLSPKGGERRRTRSRDNNTQDAARRGEETRGSRRHGSSGAGRSSSRSSSATPSEAHEEGEPTGGNGFASERDPGGKTDHLPPPSPISTTRREQRVSSRPSGHWASRREESRRARSNSASRREEDDTSGVPSIVSDPSPFSGEVDKERNLASHFQHPPRSDRGQHRRNRGTVSVPDIRTRSRSQSVSREDGNSYRSAGRSTMASSSTVSDNQESAESERHPSPSGDRKGRGRSPTFGIEAREATRSRSKSKPRRGDEDISVRGSSRSSHRRTLPDLEHSDLQVSRRSSASETSSKRGQSGNHDGEHQHQDSRDNGVHKPIRSSQQMAISSSHHGGQLAANLAQLNSPPTRKGKPHRDDEYPRSRSKSTERGDDNESGFMSPNVDALNETSGELVAENTLLSPRSERRRDRRSSRAGPTENETPLTSDRKHRGHRSARGASPNQANDGSHPIEGDAALSSRRRGSSSSRTHRHARRKSRGPSEQDGGNVDDQNSSSITPGGCESIHRSGHNDSPRGTQYPVSSSAHLPDDRSRSPSQRRQSRRSMAKSALAMSLSPHVGRKSMTASLATTIRSSGIGSTRRSSHIAMIVPGLPKSEMNTLSMSEGCLDLESSEIASPTPKSRKSRFHAGVSTVTNRMTTGSSGSRRRTRTIGFNAESASYEALEKNEEGSLHLTAAFLEYKRRSSSVTTTSTLPFSDSVLSLDHEDE